jgi:hypothetical protein
MKKFVAIVSAAILAGLTLSGCGNVDQSGIFSSDTKGLKVESVLSTTKESAKNLATLDLPKDAMPSPNTAVTVTKIDSLKNLPAGIEFYSGVTISPDGTSFDKAGNLKLTLPSANQSSEKLIGFSFSGEGEEIYFYPTKLQNNTAIFPLSGFSGYGILILKDEKASLPPPSSIEKQACQYIARIAAENGMEVNADQTTRIGNILRGWFNSSVQTNLETATGNDTMIDPAFHEFLKWESLVQFFGLDDSFANEISKARDTLTKAILNASEKAGKVCLEKKDPSQAAKMMRYAKIVQAMGLVGNEKINELIVRCVNFKITIESTMGVDAFGAHGSVSASGEGAITADDAGHLSGSAEVTTTSYFGGAINCTPNMAETWPITIPAFTLTSSTTEGGLELPMDIGSPPEGLVWDCSTQEITSIDPNTQWNWDLLHQDERTGISDGGTIGNYLIKDWEMGGGDGIFATKTYSRSMSAESVVPGIGMQGTFSENTVIKLIHTPK